MDGEGDAGSGAERLFYRVDGPLDAPPLLLLHALGATLALWSSPVEGWAEHFRVVRYDMRGHGRSAVPRREYTIEDLGRDAIRVLDAVGASTAHVCGISIGALTALWLGIHQPSRVRSLVI